MQHPFIFGLFFSLLQLTSIGTQNLFVIRAGLSNEKYLFLICLMASCLDTSLVALSIFGLGEILIKNKNLMMIFKYTGISFLLYYGLTSFKKFIIKRSNWKIEKATEQMTLKFIFLTSVLLSYGNPIALIDGVIVIGALSIQYTRHIDKFLFFLSSSLASFIWFFFLGYLAKLINPLFKKESAWKVLDLITAFTMFFMAYNVYINLKI